MLFFNLFEQLRLLADSGMVAVMVLIQKSSDPRGNHDLSHFKSPPSPAPSLRAFKNLLIHEGPFVLIDWCSPHSVCCFGEVNLCIQDNDLASSEELLSYCGFS